MAPTNDTGSVLNVGPDADGHYFMVDPGMDYDLPSAPKSVEAYQPPEEPPSAPKEELGSTETHDSGEQPDLFNNADTEGASA